MSDKEKSLLKRSLEARAVYGFLTPKPEKPSKPSRPSQEEIEAERARLEEEKKKRQINPFSTLYLTGADFTGKGFEAKGFVSVDDKVGDVFSIRDMCKYNGVSV